MTAPDPVSETLDLAAAIVRGRPGPADVDALAARLDGLGASGLVRFERSARHWRVGFAPKEIAALRSRWRKDHRHRAWTLLALVSGDGHAREAAIAEVELRAGTVGLLVLRSTDWVAPVRAAALRRLDAVPARSLLDALALVDHLARWRVRGDELGALLDRRLGEDDLRAATRAEHPFVRRAAWRRLIDRGAYDARQLRDGALEDADVMVRAAAAGVVDELDEPGRRLLAERLVGDRVARLAARGLAVLVELDGEPAIRAALTSPNVALRRHARGWAAARGIDARAVHLEELARDPENPAALIALAEIGDARDEAVLHGALEARAAVRAAALKALAHLDPGAVKAVALREIDRGAGRPGRAAISVLERVSLDRDDLRRLAAVVHDPARTGGARLRALAALRRSRWVHLATLLQARASAHGSLLDGLDGELRWWLSHNSAAARGPDDETRAAIATFLPGLDAPSARRLRFILATTGRPAP